MIVVVSDTHRRTGHGLEGRTLEAVDAADAVVHAGDFTTGAVLDAIADRAPRLHAVHGNADAGTVRDRLPARRVVDVGGLRLAVVHGHEHGETALSMLGRQEGADVVAFGHSHRPTAVDTGGPILLNPGSHARPRGHRAAHAELTVDAGRAEGRLVEPDGTVFETFEVRPEGRRGERGE